MSSHTGVVPVKVRTGVQVHAFPEPLLTLPWPQLPLLQTPAAALVHPAWSDSKLSFLVSGMCPNETATATCPQSHRATGLTIQLRHQGISEDVLAPDHFTLRGTGAKTHPKAEKDMTWWYWVYTKAWLCLSGPQQYSALTTGLARRTSCRQCSCRHRQSVHPASRCQHSIC